MLSSQEMPIIQDDHLSGKKRNFDETKESLKSLPKLIEDQQISLRAKKEISPHILLTLDRLITEGLTKSKEIDILRENVIHSLKSLNLNEFSWHKYFNFKEKEYTRNLVLQNELYELLIICWDRDCQTPIHDHPSDGCWMVGVEGSIYEEKFIATNSKDELIRISLSDLSEGEIAYIHDCIGLHSVGNSSKVQRAVTLHLYSPPIKKCYSYNKEGLKSLRTLRYSN